jgi:predicted PurR-regulated permease PerM
MHMIGFDVRAARIAWTVGLIALLLYAIYEVRRTLFIFVLAVFFSYLVYPLVRYVDRFRPRRVSHTFSTIGVFALITLLLVGVGALVGPPMAEQAALLGQQLPQLIQDPHLADRVPLPAWFDPLRPRIEAFLRDQVQTGASYAIPVARRVGQEVVEFAGNLVFVVLIPILGFLFVKDGPAMRDRFLGWVSDSPHSSTWIAILRDIDSLLARYIRALLLLSIATFAAYSLFFSIVEAPYGLLLAGVAGFLEFIPLLGPLVAGVVCLVVAGFAGYPHVLWIVAFIAAYRGFQDYLLNPYLMSGGVSIHPLLLFFGLLAGAELGGIAGIFLSVPVIAVAKIVTKRMEEARDARRAGIVSAETMSPMGERSAVLETQEWQARETEPKRLL